MDIFLETIRCLVREKNSRGWERNLVPSEILKLIEYTAYLADGGVVERIYHVVNSLTERPTCYCGNDLGFLSFNKGYREFCSTKCIANSKVIQQKIKETTILRHGVENAAQSQAIKDKITQTNMSRYGVKRPLQSSKFRNKVKETNLKNYGHEYGFQSRTVKLLRFCNKLNTSVVGGASKLLAAFDKDHTAPSLISYADLRWSVGNLYKQLGFTWKHDSVTNFWYVINDRRVGRQVYQKHKQHKVLEGFDPTLTAAQNMIEHGIYQIHDVGNGVWKREK